MSSIIQYQVQPKQIDSDGIELSLPLYNIEANGDNLTTSSLQLLDASKYIDLPFIANHKIIEFSSDQEVYFSIYDSTGTTQIIEFEAVKNLILKANLNYVYKVKNISGYTATINWRLYL